MDFTPDEEKMIAWLRRQHSAWRTTRMITLIASGFFGCAAAWEFHRVGMDVMTLLLLLVGVAGISYTLGSWAGRPEVSILLKLAEAARDRAQA